MAESSNAPWRMEAPAQAVAESMGGAVGYEGHRKLDRFIRKLPEDLRDYVSTPLALGREKQSSKPSASSHKCAI